MKVPVFLLGLLIVLPVSAAQLGSSYVKLFKVQQQMAETGDAGAEYNLGEMYEQGLGTKPDRKAAYNWYKKAAKQGDFRAKHKLASWNQNPDEEPGVVPSADAASLTPDQLAQRRAAAKAALAKEIKRSRAHDSDIGW